MYIVKQCTLLYLYTMYVYIIYTSCTCVYLYKNVWNFGSKCAWLDVHMWYIKFPTFTTTFVGVAHRKQSFAQFRHTLNLSRGVHHCSKLACGEWPLWPLINSGRVINKSWPWIFMYVCTKCKLSGIEIEIFIMWTWLAVFHLEGGSPGIFPPPSLKTSFPLKMLRKFSYYNAK